MKSLVWTALSLTFVAGCATQPQIFSRYITPVAPDYYVVQSGDTLSTIAQRYGLNYREIAALNQIDSSYVIYVGQRIRLKGKVPQVRVSGAPTSAAIGVTTNQTPTRQAPQSNQSSIKAGEWMRPAKGSVLARYNLSQGIKGVRYSGTPGDPVYAAKAGEVIYASNGLKEYGNLILIRHGEEFISAYAHNRNLLVEEKQQVRQGQKIAELGSTGTSTPMLEFQIRKNGLPVDPEPYLAR